MDGAAPPAEFEKAPTVDAVDSTRPQKRAFDSRGGGRGRGRGPKRLKRERKKKPVKEGGAEEVLAHDITALLKALSVEESAVSDVESLPEKFSEVEVEISMLSSTGDGLGVREGRAYVVPFSVTGDVVKAKIVRHMDDHTVCDFLSVVKPGPDRDDTLISCKYFTTCSGCQYQMLSYDVQLAQKKTVIERAYANFASGLGENVLPAIGDTIGSPEKYGYRTKLTPHFDGPYSGWKPDQSCPPVGFMLKGQRKTIDIEDCPIGTDAVRKGMREKWEWMQTNFRTYKKGATILLRETTIRTELGSEAEDSSTVVTADGKRYKEEKTYITDNNATSVEYVDSFRFSNPAGSFFQNNNSILPSFISYICSSLTSPSGSSSPKYLVDAYCGSGLFSVACSTHPTITRTIGVDISPASIQFASRNAEDNNITNASFITGKAEEIFADIDFPGEETTVIVDPPRKGSDEVFLAQLVRFAPRRIVYVSCNVHTQARDLEWFLTKTRKGEEDSGGEGYRVESIRGFDFFPQTHHVESVAVLERVG